MATLKVMDPDRLPAHLRPVLNALAATIRRREPAIREEVERLRSATPWATDEELARLLIRSRRRRVAAAGAASGAAAIMPGVGTVLAIGSAAGQGLYALEQETELVLAIAYLYGHELASSDERLLEALVVVGIAGGAVQLRENLLIAGGQRITVAAFRRLPQALAARTGTHFLARTLSRMLATRAAAGLARAAPIAIGMAVGAGFDWLAVTALGRAALRYYGPGGPASRSPGSVPMLAGSQDAGDVVRRD